MITQGTPSALVEAMMTNKTLIATAAMAVLTLGVVACDRSDKSSTTNTTAAEAPNDPSTLTAVPQDQTLDKDAGVITEGTLPQRNAPSMGPSQQSSDMSGVNNRGSVTNSGTPMNGKTGPAAAPDATTEVAPGHIMFPPEKNGPATGQPNSNGSQNIGASGPVDRR